MKEQKIMNRAKSPSPEKPEVGAWRAAFVVMSNLRNSVSSLKAELADLRAKYDSLASRLDEK